MIPLSMLTTPTTRRFDPASGRPKARSSRAFSRSKPIRQCPGAKRRSSAVATRLPAIRPHARLQAPAPSRASTRVTVVDTTKVDMSMAKRVRWRKSRMSRAAGTALTASMRTPTRSSRTTPVADSSPMTRAKAGAPAKQTANRTLLVATDRVATVGWMRSTSFCQRRIAEDTPSSLMLRVALRTTRAMAKTPKSSRVRMRAMAMPTSTVPNRLTRVLSRLQASPRRMRPPSASLDPGSGVLMGRRSA